MNEPLPAVESELLAPQPAGLSETRKSLLLLAGVVVALALLNLTRLERLTGDQFTFLSILQYEANPDAYAEDGLFQDPNWYHSYLPWFRAFNRELVRLVGDGPLALWLSSTLLTMAMAGTAWLCFSWLKIRPWLATAGAVLFILPRAAAGSELTGAVLIDCALPRTFFSVGFPLALFCLLKSKLRGAWCIAGFFLLGLLGNSHAQSAFFATGGLLLMLLCFRWREWRAWLLAPVCGLAAVLGVLPFSLTYPWETSATTADAIKQAGQPVTRMAALQRMMVAGGSRTDEEATAPSAAQTTSTTSQESQTSTNSAEQAGAAEDASEASGNTFTQWGANAWAGAVALTMSVLQDINYKVTLPTLLLAVLPMYLAVRWIIPQRTAAGDSRLEAARFCYQAALLIGLLAVGIEIFNRALAFWQASIPFLDSVQPLRGTRLIAPLCVMALVLYLSVQDWSQLRRSKRFRWAIAAGLFPVLVTVGTVEYVYQVRYRPMREAALWAKENTPPDAVFLVDPPGAVAFRVWANRPVVWAKHDAVCVKRSLRSTARKEIRKITEALAAETPDLALFLAKKLHADYVLYPQQANPLLTESYLTSGPFLCPAATKKTELARPHRTSGIQRR